MTCALPYRCADVLSRVAPVNRVLDPAPHEQHGVVNASTRLLRRTLAAATALLLAVGLSACGITVPTDPEGTLDTVTGGQLRVGVSAEPGLVSVDGDDPGGAPTGSIPTLVSGFADSLDAEVEWTEASEETLVGMLERGELDLVAGGMTDQTLWVDRAGVSRGYPQIDGADGRSLVMLVPLGENAFLSALERYLDERVGS